MIRRVVALAAALGTIAAPACAGQANLRVYSILKEAATVTVDDALRISVPANTAVSATVTPGKHHFALTTASGLSHAFDTTLYSDGMATARGTGWWCIVVGPDGSGVFAGLDTMPRCQHLLEIGPPAAPAGQ